ncbi:LAETG motif-containing sortase-dependent surface protein [Streptomyces sp. NPDC012389]|uniref:LAETG motif-containing sortase-dependent surface protein n=1 Tax=unclassified Streptomyces TaxID=2593676 RepID=UPI00081F015D|nr:MULTISPECIES: LAETG motif-containing sortase-dependent surface protein [unclassified Streptomyces]MYR93840.1 LPXTG cell wall anchor domain-containing protein [Streptomyces sp. SID4937]MYX18293.1 LPXTG cell wall anchor domain-containing protein [Streptomyces sp. SID8374]SCD60061.1 LPXTG-motif cell wall anchor domain-containing protein [Streptomyces sp. ScaeMP-e83]
MTIPRRSWRGAGVLVAAAVVGLTGGVITAGPAAAHTPTWAVTCDEVTVDLKYYTPNVPNTVTVTVDGKDLLPTETFGKEFSKKLTLPEHSEKLTVRLVVKDGSKGGKYSYEGEKTADVCEGEPTPTPTPTESTPEEPTPTESTPTEPTPTESTPSETPGTETPEPSDTPSAEPSESAPAVPAPSESSPPLAETGSSSATPVIGGAAAAVLLAGGGILWAVRKRRTTQA